MARGRLLERVREALFFLYRDVLGSQLEGLSGVPRPRGPIRRPVVLSQGEVQALLRGMRGAQRLIAALIYGAGLRLQECLQLRVKDLDFERGELIVWRGEGDKDRVTLLAERLRAALPVHSLWHFVRHPSAGGAVRHSDGAGAVGASGREHDDGVHARAQPGRSRLSGRT